MKKKPTITKDEESKSPVKRFNRLGPKPLKDKMLKTTVVKKKTSSRHLIGDATPVQNKTEVCSIDSSQSHKRHSLEHTFNKFV